MRKKLLLKIFIIFMEKKGNSVSKVHFMQVTR